MKKGKISGLLPILIFLILFIISGIIFHDFYAMPPITAFIIALAAAFLQNPKRNFNEKLSSAAKSMGNENVMIMCLVFILAGAFSGTVQAAGGVDSTVNFCLSILPPNVAVAGLFLIACFISIAMGTSVGTIAALTPIAVGISQKTDFAATMCVGAVICGAMFGDNLSFISDTTIAAARTQGCQMKDKFKENFKIVLPAAIITFILFLLLATNSSYEITDNLTYNLFKILPYIIVLIGATAGLNVFAVLILGTIFSAVVGIATGEFALTDLFKIMANGTDGNGGIINMYDIAVISIIVAGIIGLVKDNGGIDFILENIKKYVKNKKSAEFAIAILSLLVDVSTANNTVAIVMAGPIAKDIADEFNISPKRSASLLDIFSSVGQGLIPYGAQLLYAAAGAAAVGIKISPAQLFPYLFYPVLMAVSAILFIALEKDKSKKIK